MATKLTGDQCYKHIAEQHFQQVTKTIIREDASTYHTFYFDPVTGEASYGATHQGYTNVFILFLVNMIKHIIKPHR
ncbi:hypothetical protein ACT453_23990, partial [Bacillus sp. D-CC]